MMRIIQWTALFFCCLFVRTQATGQAFWHLTNEFPGGPKTGITRSGDCLFVGLLNGVIRSCDEGNTFEGVLDAEVIFCVYAAKTGMVYAGGAGKIYSTANLGDSWDSVSVGTYPITEFVENSQGDLFAISGVLDIDKGYLGDGVLFSGDSGQSWTQRNNGLGIYISCEHIVIDKNDRLYVASADEFVTGNGGLFVSNDHGLNWQHLDITIDGRGVVADEIKIGNTTGLSVSPEDTLYFSFMGVAVNASVQLNTRRSINDVGVAGHWHVYNVFDAVSWWLDRMLRDIHFAKNGHWYSSIKGSINTGATYFSTDQGLQWSFIDYGLGLDIIGLRNVQYFAENPHGRVYMTQLLDERIYNTDTSATTSIKPVDRDVQRLSVFPNPVLPGAQLTLHSELEGTGAVIEIYDVSGQLVESRDFAQTIPAPDFPGVYTIRAIDGDKVWVTSICVQK